MISVHGTLSVWHIKDGTFIEIVYIVKIRKIIYHTC